MSKLADIQVRVIVAPEMATPQRHTRSRKAWLRDYYNKNRRALIARSATWNKENKERRNAKRRKSI